MAKKLALGKGIGSLLQTHSNEIMTAALQENFADDESEKFSDLGQMVVDLKMIKINPNQPRKIFKEKELEELAISIKENGVIQPLIVSKSDGKGYELIAGERRLRASKIAGIDKVPVIIKRATDKEKMVMSIIENVQRSDLNCVEEALAYFQLMDDFKLTQEEVAKKIGKERSTIANFLRILRLPREVVELLQKEFLSFGHAKLLASVKESDKSIRIANLCVSKNLSVRELESELQKDKKGTKYKEPRNPFFNEKLDGLKENLEKLTGFHFAIKSKKNGNGTISIKFNNEAEFNDIYDYILKR